MMNLMEKIKKSAFARAARPAALGAIALCAAWTGGSALAQQPDIGITYGIYLDPNEPTYQLALQEMKTMYQKDPLVWDGTQWFRYPAIGIGQTLLNNDRLPELVLYPAEDSEEAGKYCQQDGKCPHIVVEVGQKETVRLLVVPAYTITRDPKGVTNGYSDLRVYTKHPDEDPYYYVTYKFNGKGKYELAPR